METVNQVPGGKISRGWSMTKSAWRVLMLDKELAIMPLLSTVASVALLTPFLLFAWAKTGFMNNVNASTNSQAGNGWQAVIWVVIIVIGTIITNFFAGAIVHAALQRFRGGDPTVRGSLAAAWAKIGPIAAFSVLAATVGYLLSLLEQRLPFAGKIAAWIADAAWSIATLFAIPVIVDSQEYVGPIEAVRKSAGIVKQTWGENIVVSVGIAIIGMLSFLASIVIVGGVGALLVSVGAPSLALIAYGVIAVMGMILLAVIFSLLSAIAKVAIYYYATTGKAPEVFSQELLHAAMTPKKARKIFS